MADKRRYDGRWLARVMRALGELHRESGDGAWTAMEIGERAYMAPQHVGHVCGQLQRAGLVAMEPPERRGASPRYRLSEMARRQVAAGR